MTVVGGLFVKICGITQVQQAQVLASLGIQAIGLIGVPQTPRYVSPDQMRAIVAVLPEGIESVGVFRNEPLSHLMEVVDWAGLTTVQLHGEETPADCEALSRCRPQLRVIKAFRLREPEDLQRIQLYQTVVHRVLVDAYHPQQLGGTGLALDWSGLRQFAFPVPWILAGGLKPENIQMALRTVQPFGIDVSSGVEVSPGIKDLDRVKQLLTQIDHSQSSEATASGGGGDLPRAERSAP